MVYFKMLSSVRLSSVYLTLLRLLGMTTSGGLRTNGDTYSIIIIELISTSFG